MSCTSGGDHDWKVVREDEGSIYYECQAPGCGATSLVTKRKGR